MSVFDEKYDGGDILRTVVLTFIIEYALVLKSFILSDRFFADLLTPTQSATNWKTQKQGHLLYWRY